MLRLLLQPRYAALSVLMVIVAAICTAAGVWQVVRLSEKIGANDDLRNNAHATEAPIASVLPVVGQGVRPETDAVEYRSVIASGTYLANEQVLVRQRSVNSDTGYLVLTPFQTTEGPILLVVRGFVSATSSSNSQVPTVAAPPPGAREIHARVQPGETRDDQFGALHNDQVESINPTEIAPRIGGAVYNGYANLLAGQPGTDGLVAIPDPDLSNPAGGAIEPQHLAYVIQWFLFAALALAAPFVMARAESRRSSNTDLDITELDVVELGESHVHEPGDDDVVAARLGDRYGRSARRFR